MLPMSQKQSTAPQIQIKRSETDTDILWCNVMIKKKSVKIIYLQLILLTHKGDNTV